MSTDDLGALGVKLDMITDRLNRVEIALTMQQTAMTVRVDWLKENVDRMIGGKLHPYWVYAIIMCGGILVGYLAGIKVGAH